MGKKHHPVLLLFMLAVILASAPALSAPVGFEEIRDVFEHPKFVARLSQCHGYAPTPARIEIMLEVKPKKAMSIVSVSPVPSSAIRECMDRLVAKVKFLPAGETLVAQWSVDFDSGTAIIYVVTREAPISAVRDKSMAFKRAKKTLFVGVGISGVGFITMAAAPFYIFFSSMSGLFGGCDPDYGCPPMNMTPVWALLGTGGAVLTAGLVLLITGGVRKYKASKWLRSGGFLGFAVSPLPDRTGGMLSMTWRF
jgi:hypothetical protein